MKYLKILHNKYTITLFLFLISSLWGFATHIVGGSLTYVYNGGNSYTFTLKLYRDGRTGTAAAPATTALTFRNSDGTTPAGISLTLNPLPGTGQRLPSPLDSCATPPSNPPIVEEYVYTGTVNLPLQAGSRGYHVYYTLCCRQNNITNINNPGGTGEAFYVYVPGPVWVENFPVNGWTSDAGSTAWTRTMGSPAPATAITAATRFQVTGAVNGSVVWSSEILNISRYTSGVNLSADLFRTGTLDTDDTIQVYYSLNGGPLTLWATNGQFAGNFTTNTTATQANLTGSTVQIYIRVRYGSGSGGSPTSEVYQWDNIMVVPNSDIWVEDFTFANNTNVDNGTTAWSITQGTTPTNYAAVNNNMFEVRGANGSSATWASQSIDISSYLSGVNLSMDIQRAGTMENDDSLLIYYSLDGGPLTLWSLNGSLSGNFTSPATAASSGLIGNNIQIYVRTRFSATSPNSEIFRWDNLRVASSASYNNSPNFGQAPPLFLCQSTPFTYDHSATDLDGDSLVYSLYTPYDEDAPTYVDNAANFTGVSWLAGYSASSPLNSGGPGLTIDPATGVLSGTPNNLGEFVIGVKVSEYRNGRLLNEVVRDYQFSVVYCAPPAQAYITSNKHGDTLNVCSGNGITFPNNSTVTAERFFWDFGVTNITTDTSSQKFPTYTYPGAGTYTATLITNRGTNCADTATVKVIVGFITAQNIWASTNNPCVNATVTFTTAVAAVSSNNSVTSYRWNFGDGSPAQSGLNLRNVSHAYSIAGTYTVSLTTTGSLSCTSTTQTVITVYAMPTTTVSSSGSKTITICANTNTVAVSGATNAVATWTTTGTGTFNPDNSTSAITYSLSSADKNLTQLLLIFTATGQGGCGVYTTRDTIVVNVVPLPTPTVGLARSITICSNNPVVILTGSVGSGVGTWSTPNGTGTFNPDNSISANNYTLSNGDIAALNVRLILTADGISACSTQTRYDTLDVVVTPEPIASVGISKSTTVCASNRSIAVAGFASNGTGVWSSTGTGSFIPNTTIAATSYTLSDADTASGFVKLYFSVTGTNGCASVTAKDSLQITIMPEPVAITGLTDTIYRCASDSIINIAGRTIYNGGAIWSSSGTGRFTPNTGAGATSYVFSNADTTAREVKLYLTVSGTGVCGSVQTIDSTIILITPEPISITNLGDTLYRCSNDSIINLTGRTVYNGDALWSVWSSSGSGAFNPSDDITAVNYTLSQADTTVRRVTLILTVTGNAACGSVQAVDSTVILIRPEPVAITGLADTIYRCASDSIINISGRTIYNGGAVWSSNGNGRFVPIANQTATDYILSTADTTARQVKVFLTVTSTGICGSVDAIDSTLVIISPEPVAVTGLADTIYRCASDSIVNISSRMIYNANGGIWTTGGSGRFVPVANQTATDYIFSTADTTAREVKLYLTATGTGICGSVQSVDSTLIVIAPEPISSVGVVKQIAVCANVFIVPIANDTLIYNGNPLWTSNGTGSFIPNAVSPVSYSMSPADTTAGGVFIYLSVTGTNACGSVVAKDSLEIITSPAPNASVGVSKVTAVCTNDSDVLLTGSIVGATGGVWSSNGGGIFIPNATSLNCVYRPNSADTARVAITLTLTTTGNGACNPVQDTLRVIMNEAPHAVFSTSLTPVCKNDSSYFSASASSGIVAINNYFWNYGDGNTASSGSTNTSHLYNNHGIYSVKLRVTDANGCKDSLTQSAIVHPLPIAYYSSTAECYKGAVYFSDLSSVVNVSNDLINNWQWTFGDGGASTQQNPSHLYPAPNLYSAVLKVTTNYGCVDTVPQVLNVKPAPVADFTNTSVCLNKITDFTDISDLPAIAGNITNRNFYFGDNTTLNITSTPAFSHTYPLSGSFTATLVVDADNGCSDTATREIVIHPLPATDFDASVFCLADKTQFTDISTIGSGSIVAWQWDFGNGNQSSNKNDSNKYSAVGQYGIILKAISNFGCENTKSKVITINPSPVADFYTDKDIIELYGSVQFTDASTGANFWKWSFGDGGEPSTLQSPSYTYNKESGTFVSKLVVTNTYNCSDSATKEIIVKLPPKIPNAFTPNGDGENDVLYVMGGPYRKLEFRILNNWGEYIFVSQNQSQGWDGTKNGVKQPIGVYVYTLIAETEDGEQHTLYGDVTLLR